MAAPDHISPPAGAPARVVVLGGGEFRGEFETIARSRAESDAARAASQP